MITNKMGKGARAILAGCGVGAAALAIGALTASTAMAQTSEHATVGFGSTGQTGLQPSLRVSTPPSVSGVTPYTSSVPPLPVNEALLPDFGGYRAMLMNHGVYIGLDDVDEFSGIVEGDHKGSTNAGQYGLETDIDWEKLAGIRGFSTHSIMVGRYGIPASRIFGDNLDPSQEIYGAGGNVAIHLVDVYAEETLAHGRFDIVAGRMPVLNDFASSPLFCNFMNNAFCGNPKASSDNFAVSSYPDANWAFRIRVRPTALTYIQSGIFFTEDNIYNATGGFRSGFRFNSAHISGETFPVEAGIEPFLGRQKMPGHYRVGFIYDTNKHNDDYYDVNGNAFALTGAAPRVRHGQTAEYVLFDQMLLRHAPGAGSGLIGIAGFYHNDDNTSTRTSQAEVGLIDHGFWKARPQDGFALAFSYLEVSDALSKTEALQQELGEPIIGTGVNNQFYDNSATGVQSHTYNFEANYQIHVFRGVTFAPDFQYFIRPNALANVGNAAVLGFKSHIQLF